ncbi:MAG: MATE family efflux transporter [Methanobrevibacter sp.]|jgi:putative MATE family efflux protein|nr:MATE family efflux transporter [Methanobrevibacter sp.]
MSENNNKGVSILQGDPKKAILKLAIPTIFAMLINSVYSLVDGFWVGGLGASSIAAVGFINPLFLIVVGFSNGLGAGATSVISRYIGVKDKKQVDNAALHVLLLTIILSSIFTFILVLFLNEILGFMGLDSRLIDMSASYGQILFSGSVFIVFTSAAYGILRAEGNVKKATYAMLLAAVINIILDPIFIYKLNMGVFGAGLATILSLLMNSILLIYWFIKGTYVNFSLKNFKYRWDMVKRILSVGLPAGAEFLIISFLNFFLNSILLMCSDIDGVAIYTAGWRVVMLALVIPLAIGTSVVSVTGANYGAGKIENLKPILNYSIKLGLLIITFVAIFIFIFAPQIGYIFAYLPGLANIRDLITEFLRVTCLFYFFVPIGISATSVFQGIGKGLRSLLLTTVRLFILEICSVYFLAILLGWGQYGVWYGIVLGNALGATFSYLYTLHFINKANKKGLKIDV